MAVITDRFEATARAMARASGLPDYPFAIIAHPIAGNTDEALRDKAEAVHGALVRLLTERASTQWPGEGSGRGRPGRGGPP